MFQLFDGIQGVITGTLRGIGDTRTPMVVNLAAHWLLGLPVSYTLCFVVGWGVGDYGWAFAGLDRHRHYSAMGMDACESIAIECETRAHPSLSLQPYDL